MIQITPDAPKRMASIRGANIVLLISMLLFITLGLWLQTLSLMWGTVASEFILLIVVVLYIAIARLPLRETLRLHWPGWKLIAYVVILGIGLILAASSWGSVVSEWLDYDLPVPPEYYPTNVGESILFVAALALVAPLCEETLFRGLLQHTHERNGVVKAILVVAVIFAGFHLSFLRFLVLLPVAVVLGFVAWRSQSLAASFTLHAVYNGVAGILSLVGTFRPDLVPSTADSSTVLLIIAGLFLLVGFWGLIRASEARPAPLERDNKPVFKRSWPLIPVFVIMAFALVSEPVISKNPQLFAAKQLTLPGTPATGGWSYMVYDLEEQVIGTAEAQVTRVGSNYDLTIKVSMTPQQKLSASQNPVGSLEASYTWDGSTLTVVSGDIQQTTAAGTLNGTINKVNDGLRLDPSGNNAQSGLVLPADVLLPGEWPWRLTASEFSELSAWMVSVVSIQADGFQQVQADGTSDHPILQNQGAEPLAVPAGNYIAWKVTLGEQTAWYDSQAPHTLLRYDDGQHSLRLASAASR